jgi:hypothetical protein
LEERPEVDLVHCGYYYVDKDGFRLEKVAFLPDGTLRDLAVINQIFSGAPLIRRQCLEQIGLFDETLPWRGQYAEDWDMWLRIAQAGCRFACVQEPLGAYRMLPDSVMSNVSKMEDGAFAVLDKLFSDPRLPADVVAVQPEAYGNTHLWLSWRYYDARMWDDAQRNLANALTLLPQPLTTLEVLQESICGDALSVRVGEPVEFVLDLLEHLPLCAARLRRYRTRLLAHIHVGLALRNYARGNIKQAKQEIENAVSLRPALLQHTEEFAKLLRHRAVKLPIMTPERYVETVLQNLPPGAQQLAQVRSRVLGEVIVARAFESYFSEQQGEVVSLILRALILHPSILGNRGPVSVLLRSLRALVALERATG